MANKVLYDSFIKNNCSIVLFEKCDYIRDRSIYRPSHVAGTSNDIQTSLHVRSQIDSLPDSAVLYTTVNEIHAEICESIEDGDICSVTRECGERFCFTLIDCQTEYAEQLGYSWNILEQLGGYFENKSVPQYIAQAMELFTPQVLTEFYEKYWKAIIASTRERLY